MDKKLPDRVDNKYLVDLTTSVIKNFLTVNFQDNPEDFALRILINLQKVLKNLSVEEKDEFLKWFNPYHDYRSPYIFQNPFFVGLDPRFRSKEVSVALITFCEETLARNFAEFLYRRYGLYTINTYESGSLALVLWLVLKPELAFFDTTLLGFKEISAGGYHLINTLVEMDVFDRTKSLTVGVTAGSANAKTEELEALGISKILHLPIKSLEDTMDELLSS